MPGPIKGVNLIDDTSEDRPQVEVQELLEERAELVRNKRSPILWWIGPPTSKKCLLFICIPSIIG